MSMNLVEEINRKTYKPGSYFSSIHLDKPGSKSGCSKLFGKPNKRVNYSLADLEAKTYAQNRENLGESETSNDSTNINSFERYSQQELIKSDKRFMELDTENYSDIKNVSFLMSSITGINKDRIDQTNTAISTGDSDSSSIMNRSRNKYELPKNIELMYRSNKPPALKRKSTNKVIALKKTLSSKRPLTSYLDTLDQVSQSIIFNNVYNKKFSKVLPVITVCSICGGYDSISSCVQCHDKVCSLRCFNLHNETRCSV